MEITQYAKSLAKKIVYATYLVVSKNPRLFAFTQRMAYSILPAHITVRLVNYLKMRRDGASPISVSQVPSLSVASFDLPPCAQSIYDKLLAMERANGYAV